MIKKICFFLALVLLIQGVYGADTPGDKKSKIVSITMFIPGVQQIKTGKYGKGCLFLAAFLGSSTAVFAYNKKGNDWYDKYRISTNVNEVILFRQNTEKYLKKRNISIAALISTWLLHIIDLKLFKSKKGGVTGDAGKNKFNIGFYYSF
ncbi:MAG: hypothetical protein GY757_06180 [bacterium]|nr:hypothetical protein [bacterium]